MHVTGAGGFRLSLLRVFGTYFRQYPAIVSSESRAALAALALLLKIAGICNISNTEVTHE